MLELTMINSSIYSERKIMLNNNAIYSNWKIFHYDKELEMLRKNEYPTPRMIQMDIFNPCNHNCYFCVHRFHENENFNKNFLLADSLKKEKVFEVIEDAIEMNVKSFVLSGGGEPTLHPDFLSIAQKITDNFDMGLITNGASRNNWGKKESLMAEVVGRITWVRFSINGGSRTSYSKIHATSEEDFDIALKSVKNVVDSGKSTVGISYVVNYWNYHEISQFTKIASDLGVGVHKVSVRFQDALGTWSIPQHQNITVSNPFVSNYSNAIIVAAEYYIDTDPGLGNGTLIDAADGSFDGTLEDIDFSVLASDLGVGIHNIFVRFINDLDFRYPLQDIFQILLKIFFPFHCLMKTCLQFL